MVFGLGLLTFGTLGMFAAFGYINMRATQKLRDDKTAPKSALSKDGIAERLARVEAN